MYFYSLLIFLVMSLSACAFAPLATSTTGRSEGKGKSEIQAGSVPGGAHLKYTVGITDNFDLGAHTEFHLFGGIGAHAKYSLINNKEKGFSTAVIGGAGSGIFQESYYYYVGPVISYKINFFEPYTALRYNGVYWPKSSQNSTVVVLDDDIHFSYLQLAAGSFFWFSDRIGLSAEAVWFAPTTDRVKFQALLLTTSLAFKF